MGEKKELKFDTNSALTGQFFLVLFVLKEVGVIDWSWAWVTAPLWMPLAFGLSLIVIGVSLGALGGLLDPKTRRRKKNARRLATLLEERRAGRTGVDALDDQEFE